MCAAFTVPSETFAPLEALPQVRHRFLQRIPGLDVKADRDEALARLWALHEQARERLGFAGMPLITANQVHGRDVAVVDAATVVPVQNVDALVTNQPGVCLGVDRKSVV